MSAGYSFSLVGTPPGRSSRDQAVLAPILFGASFAVHLLWWFLILVLILAILGWLFGRRGA